MTIRLKKNHSTQSINFATTDPAEEPIPFMLYARGRKLTGKQKRKLRKKLMRQNIPLR